MRVVWPLLALGAASLLGGCGGADKSDHDLLFVSTRDGDYAIYGTGADGGNGERLTDAKGDSSTPRGLFFQTDPAWSPDGSTIAFASTRAGSFDLYAMNADGSGTRRLTSTKDEDRQPTWSPDGERIAFTRGAVGQIFVTAADGSGARRLTGEQVDEKEPAWSPDGRWIAYSRRQPGTSIRELWLVRPDGTQRHRLTKLGGVAEAPAWSPDGRRVVFSANVSEMRFDIYVVGADGKNVRLLTSADDAFEPSWSPDGGTIAYSTGGAISSIDVQNGDEHLLTDRDNNDSSPAWAPRVGEEEG